MTKKAPKYILTIEFKKFLNGVMQLCHDFLDQREKRNKKTNEIIKERKKISGRDAYEYAKVLDAYTVSTNALLTYAFSLYEIFISGFLKYLVTSNEDANQIYTQKWKAFVQELLNGKHKKLGVDADFILNLSSENQIEKYQVLIDSQNNGQGTTIGKFIRDLQSMGKISREDKTVKRYIAKFAIYREVRNMLTHRGSKIDKRFLDSLDSNKDIGQDKKEKDNFLLLQKDKKKKSSSLLKKEIKFDFIDVISVIVFNAFWTVIHEVSDKDNNYENFYPTDLLHSCLMFNDEQKGTYFSELNRDIFRTGMNHIFNKNIEESNDSFKFNFLLSEHQYLHRLMRILKGIKKNRNNTKDKKVIEEIINSNNEFFSKTFKKYFIFNEFDINIQNLLESYLKNSKKGFMKEFNNLDFNRDEINGWYIFQKYKNDNDFIKIANKKKNKNVAYFKD